MPFFSTAHANHPHLTHAPTCAEFKFTYLWWLFIILGFCVASDENWSWYYNALDGGFVGGFGASRGVNNDLAGLVPCASMSTKLAQQPAEKGPGHKWWPEVRSGAGCNWKYGVRRWRAKGEGEERNADDFSGHRDASAALLEQRRLQ